MAHTPGPWHFEEDEELEYTYDTELFTGYSIMDNELNQIAIVPTDQFDEKESIANGLLLAASSDLLEACKAAQVAIDDLVSQLPNDERLATFNLDSVEDAKRQVIEAITKARGE